MTVSLVGLQVRYPDSVKAVVGHGLMVITSDGRCNGILWAGRILLFFRATSIAEAASYHPEERVQVWDEV